MVVTPPLCGYVGDIVMKTISLECHNNLLFSNKVHCNMGNELKGGGVIIHRVGLNAK